MRLRANTLSAQIDGSEIGVGGTRQARQIAQRICPDPFVCHLYVYKQIFLKVFSIQQVYLESNIQHLPLSHF